MMKHILRRAFKRSAALLAVLVFMLIASGCSAITKPPHMDIYVYDDCGSCESELPGCGECKEVIAAENMATTTFRDELKKKRITYKVINLRTEKAANDEYLALSDRLGISKEDRNRFPVFYVDGEPFIGMDSWDTAVEAARTQRGTFYFGVNSGDKADSSEDEEEETVHIQPRNDRGTLTKNDSVVIYFYKTWCPYCKELEPLLDGLPETITLPDGTASTVRLYSYDKEIAEDMEIVKQYYEYMKIPEDRQFVPMIVIGNEALFLRDEIVPNLMNMLIQGKGRQTVLLEK